jgi:hypothetical protein
MSNKYSHDEIIEARKRLWREGILEWKLDSTQKEIYDFIQSSSRKTVVVHCSRRLGKSYLLTTLAVEQCIKTPKAIVKFLQPEQKMIRMNIRPIMDRILEDCPADVRPRFKTMDNIYEFPNGSEIQLAGTDNGNHEKLRGGDAHICIIDEAAFVKAELDYTVKNVLLPTTTLTGGKIILLSTSPKDAGHDFEGYVQQAQLNGTYIMKTIFDAVKDESNTRVSSEIVAEIEAEYPGGRENEGFRREYLCEFVTDGDNAVIPEFTTDVAEDIVTKWPIPNFRDRYVSMDIGFKDLTVALFGYYDFMNGVTVIEDEIVINGPQMTTDVLAQLILDKEYKLWTDNFTQEFTPPYMRVSDNNLILINDLQRNYGITFMPTQKDNKEAALNNLRNHVASREIIIHPRCKNLISHLKHATWDKHRRTYTRSSDGGHYDAVDALVYMLRNIDKNKNPFPRGYRAPNSNNKDLFYNPTYKENGPNDQFTDAFSDIFKVRSSFRKK